jgi:tetratricopeptide (TPR) repeat protein
MGVRPTNLVGRRLHTLKLESAFAAIRNGRPTILHVYGQSGIGKTALIHEFLAELRRRDSDVVVLRGRCYEQEAVPYKALDSLIDDLSRYLQRLPALEAERMMPRDALTLARLFPVLGGVNAIAATHERVAPIPDTNELRRRAANALRELLARIGERHPLVLFIDDVQWGDLDSATLLEELVRPPDPPMLILLLCYRSEDAEESPLLRRIAAWVERGVAASDVVELEVDKLTPAETRDLAFSLLSSEGPAALDRADAIATESDGHPLLLTELVRHIALEPDIETPEMSLDTMIRARVAQLPVQARRLLEILAVAGRPVELTVAQQAAGLDVPADTVISMLRTGHLVRTRIAQNRHEIETYHDRIREAVITQLPAALLKTHHGRLAWSWQASGRADAETLASHFHGAGEFQHAAAYAAQAAEEAGHALAFDRAARLYRLALDLLPASAATEHALRVKLGDALADAGRGAEAADVYLVAANAAEVDEGLELRRRAADQLLISGHIDEGLATLRTVLSMVGIRLARTPARALVTLGMRRIQLRARGLRFQERDRREPSDGKLKRVDTCWAVTRGLIMVDTIRAAQFQSRHLLEALRVGEPYRVARALAIEASASVLRGRRGREHTQRVLELARELAERIRNPHAIGAVALASAAVANFLGRFPEALTMCQRAELILREQCTGVTWELDTTELYRLHSLYWLGRWSELSQRLLTVRREAEQRRDLYILTYVGTRSSHVVYLARNDAARAREEQKRSIATWSHRRFQTQHYWDWFANGEIDLFDGRVREAWLRVRQVWPEYRRSLLQRHQAIFIEALCMRARAALALSADETEHRSVSEQRGLLNEAERAADKIEHEQIPWGNALAQLLRAGVAIGRGDVSRAVMLTRLAEISFGLLGMEMHEAVALRRRGQLIGGDEGRSAQEAGDARMTAQGIGSPVKVAAMLAPGEWQ